MANILFITWDGGGNVPPAIGIARELSRRGHRVQFLGHEGNRAAITASGLPFKPYEHAMPYASSEDNPPQRMVEIFNDVGIAEDMVDQALAISADAVVVDCLMLAALGRARAEGLTYVPLEHFFDAYYRQSWLKAPFGQIAEARGFDPFGALQAAPLVIAATLPELDPASLEPSPANLLFSGPIVAAPPLRDLNSLPPTVLASFSTFNFPGQEEALQTVLDAVAELSARVIVTTGPVINRSRLRASGNVEIHEFVDHDLLMPQVSVLMGHGGHATTMRALAHGIPVAAMPQHPLLDQSMVGQAVELAGAGRFVPREASVTDVRDALGALLADGPHRAQAARLGAAIRDRGGASTAADAIEATLNSRGSLSANAPAHR